MQIAGVSPSPGPTGAAAAKKAELEKAAQQFEAIFLRQMIGAMRSASLADGITDSSATEQFRDLSDARTADAMAGTGSLGIAGLLLRQFGGADKPVAPAATDGP